MHWIIPILHVAIAVIGLACRAAAQVKPARGGGGRSCRHPCLSLWSAPRILRVRGVVDVGHERDCPTRIVLVALVFLRFGRGEPRG